MIVEPEIVLGPPGTGKTTTLLGMVDEELAGGTQPNKIGYVSFTKRAANEAAERAVERFSLPRSDFQYFRTLHSVCFQALGISTGDVFERARVKEFSHWIGVEVSDHLSLNEGSTFGYLPGDRALFMENRSRVTGIPLRQLYDQNDDGLPWKTVEYMARGMRQYKRDHRLVDYTDMLELFVKGDVAPALDVLFVDEAQDLSRLQWMVVDKLAQWCRRLVIAGDDDQAIYRWAGADVDYFIGLAGRRRVLGQSWRVPTSVQAVSSQIVRRIGHRNEKEWAPRDAEGRVAFVRSTDEIDFRSEPEILVLGRNGYLLAPIMGQLRSDGVIFEWRDNSSVKGSVIAAIEAWERLRDGQKVHVDDVRSVYNQMSSGKGVRRGFKTLSKFSSDAMLDIHQLKQDGGLMVDGIWHEALDRMSNEDRMYVLRARQHGELLKKRPRVRVSTIHGAKGGEAQHVVLFTDMAQRTYQEMLTNPDDEARVWYVAATRARERLTIVAPRTGLSYDV